MKKMFSMVVEDCMSCPAHHCVFKFAEDQKCLCELSKNRKIPESVLVSFGFPEWCPLKEME